MTGPDGSPMTCPNGHPVAFAGQRFCEVCRLAIGAPAGPAAPGPVMGPPPAPPTVRPTMTFAVAGSAAGTGSRSALPKVAGLVAVIAVALVVLFVIVVHPFGGGAASPAPTLTAALASIAASPTAAPVVTPAEPTVVPTVSDSASPQPTPAATPTLASASMPTPTLAPTLTPELTPEPTLAPTPVAITGTWASPAAGSTFGTWTLDLAAAPVLPTSDAAVSSVTFNVAWKDGHTTACQAAHAGSSGTWTCTADLVQLDVPPGPLTFSFDIADAVGNVTPGAGGDLAVTYAAVPPKPANAKLKTVSDTPAADGNSSTLIERVTWTAPAGYATEFRLYAVTFCPNDSPTAKDGTPCLSEHTALPASKLKLVATANGDARSMTLKHKIAAGICGPTLWCSGDLYALVMAAYNDNGQSVYTIVMSTTICHSCTF